MLTQAVQRPPKVEKSLLGMHSIGFLQIFWSTADSTQIYVHIFPFNGTYFITANANIEYNAYQMYTSTGQTISTQPR